VQRLDRKSEDMEQKCSRVGLKSGCDKNDCQGESESRKSGGTDEHSHNIISATESQVRI
jgi:hypothetical protein